MRTAHDWLGLGIALAIVTTWGSGLAIGFQLDLTSLPTWQWASLVPALILVMTWLSTGLFITAHDAMHGSVCPTSPWANRLVGTLAVLLYALFDYRLLWRKHWQHHDHPASDDDPDFHAAGRTGLVGWYLHFLFGYVRIWQILGMAALFNLLKFGLGVPDLNLILFWVAPALLSTGQLFYYGTYLPHRDPSSATPPYDPAPDGDKHRTRSDRCSSALSLLRCYHFGYHWEHHAYPWVPWWLLPRVRQGGQSVAWAIRKAAAPRPRAADRSPRKSEA